MADFGGIPRQAVELKYADLPRAKNTQLLSVRRTKGILSTRMNFVVGFLSVCGCKMELCPRNEGNSFLLSLI